MSFLQDDIYIPSLVIVGAKKNVLEMTYSISRCIEQMIMIQEYGTKHKSLFSAIFGIVTTGTLWRFVKLEGKNITIDRKLYRSDNLQELWNVLVESKDIITVIDPSKIKGLWHGLIPQKCGLWKNLPKDSKIKWLNEVRIKWFKRKHKSDRIGKDKIIYLEGNDIQDEPSFLLALGEAINGPGGYFGGCLDALNDCLCGDCGILPPFTVVWKDHQVLKDKLSYIGSPPHDELLFDIILDILQCKGVTVVLE